METYSTRSVKLAAALRKKAEANLREAERAAGSKRSAGTGRLVKDVNTNGHNVPRNIQAQQAQQMVNYER